MLHPPDFTKTRKFENANSIFLFSKKFILWNGLTWWANWCELVATCIQKPTTLRHLFSQRWCPAVAKSNGPPHSNQNRQRQNNDPSCRGVIKCMRTVPAVLIRCSMSFVWVAVRSQIFPKGVTTFGAIFFDKINVKNANVSFHRTKKFWKKCVTKIGYKLTIYN